jgi:phage terminase large subunit
MFQRTTSINKILSLDKFIKGIQGGTSAGKTFGILPVLIDKAIKEPLVEISVVAESIPHLKRGAMKDFKKIMESTGRWRSECWNASDFKYTFPNKSMIEFFSSDSDAKLRGARRDYLYMNEANNQTFNAYNELVARTKKGVWLDWNPTNDFWFHENLINDSDVDFIILTYLDNEACPESAINFILKAKEKAATSQYWDNWYKVYGLGLTGSLQGTIFEFTQINEIPKDAQLICHALDWGFTNDPTAFISVYRYNQKILVDELIYNTGLTNSDIINKLRQLNIKDEIVADSAEPKSIEDLRRAGFRIKPAEKGKDSIRASIDTLKQFDIQITKQSLNLIKEFRSYVWEQDKEGKYTSNPIDSNNHGIDALRYVALNKLKRSSGFNYMVSR